MTHRSDPDLLVLHALRLKGFAEPPAVAEATGVAEGSVTERLATFQEQALVKRRDGKVSGFLLLPAGRDHHATLLDDYRAAAGCDDVVEAAYAAFLVHNETFKQLCTDWQLGPGDPVVIAGRLTDFHPVVAAVIDELAGAMARFGPYGDRLADAAERFAGGDPTALARPLTRSYHDVWMELHEDFLVTLRRERSAADGY